MSAKKPKYPSLMYENAAKNLLEKVKTAAKLEEVRYYFNEFCEKYTVINPLWREWFYKEFDEYYIDFKIWQCTHFWEKIETLAKTHCFFTKFAKLDYEDFKEGKFGRAYFWYFSNISFNEICKVPSKLEPFIVEHLFFPTLVYPHNTLKYFKCFTEKYSIQNIPDKVLKKYETAKKIFNGIYAIFLREEEKFARLKFLLQVKIDKMIMIENFECHIGMLSYACDKELWTLYINYLKNEGDEENDRLLNVYSRYCRLLIDFPQAQNEYRTELERQSLAGQDVEKWWIDTVEFERDFVGIRSARDVLERALQSSSQIILIKYSLWFEKEYGNEKQFRFLYNWSSKVFPELKNLTTFPKIVPSVKIKIEFNHKSDISFVEPSTKKFSKRFVKNPDIFQCFPFPSFIISYLQKNAKPSKMLKFYQSAKYFFWRQHKSPLCHNLTILEGVQSDPIFYPNSLFTTSNHVEFVGKLNLTITNSLIIFSQNVSHFSNLLPKVNLQIRHLVLTNQKLSFLEFEALTKLKLLKSVKFDKSLIEKENGTLMSVEEIISILTSLRDICILHGFFTDQTFTELSRLRKHVRLCNLELSEIHGDFKVFEFADFLKNNVVEAAFITLNFSTNVPKEQIKEFLMTLMYQYPEIKFHEL